MNLMKCSPASLKTDWDAFIFSPLNFSRIACAQTSPSPKKKIGERDDCESPSSPIFCEGRGASVHRLQPNFSTLRQSSLRKQPSLSAPDRWVRRLKTGILRDKRPLSETGPCREVKTTVNVPAWKKKEHVHW